METFYYKTSYYFCKKKYPGSNAGAITFSTICINSFGQYCVIICPSK